MFALPVCNMSSPLHLTSECERKSSLHLVSATNRMVQRARTAGIGTLSYDLSVTQTTYLPCQNVFQERECVKLFSLYHCICLKVQLMLVYSYMASSSPILVTQRPSNTTAHKLREARTHANDVQRTFRHLHISEIKRQHLTTIATTIMMHQNSLHARHTRPRPSWSEGSTYMSFLSYV